MSYIIWFEKHALKHEVIVNRLQKEGMSQSEVIDYFDFENMKLKEKDFCPLYKDNKKCHDMKELNCYLCACPNFRFSDKGIAIVDEKKQYSLCDIESKDGRQGVYGEVIHQDCSGCGVPHHRAYVEKHFGWSWKKIMAATVLDKKSKN